MLGVAGVGAASTPWNGAPDDRMYLDDPSGCSIDALIPQSYSVDYITGRGDIYCNVAYTYQICVQRQNAYVWYDYACENGSGSTSRGVFVTPHCYGYISYWRSKLTLWVGAASVSEVSSQNFSSCGR